MRLVFAGTPDAAVPSLRTLIDSPRHDVVAVVTRPDAPAGRGRRVAASPVKELAVEAGIEVLTPGRPSEPEFLDRLTSIAPDCCPVVAYGALVPQAALDIPIHGWVNLHFSLLPAWRGAAPAQWSILAGDDVGGATTFRLEAGLDTGPVFGVVTTTITPTDTGGGLIQRLADDGAGLLLATLDGIADGTIEARPQPVEGVTLAPKLTSSDAQVPWSAPAVAIDRRVRACTPAPGAWTTLRGQRFRVGPVVPDPRMSRLSPGEIAVAGEDVLVGTGAGSVSLGQIRPAGRADMAATAWARGARLAPGEAFE